VALLLARVAKETGDNGKGLFRLGVALKNNFVDYNVVEIKVVKFLHLICFLLS